MADSIRRKELKCKILVQHGYILPPVLMIASCPSCCPPTGTEGRINSSYDDASHCRAVGARLQLLQVKELPPGGAWNAFSLIISALKVLRHLFWCWEELTGVFHVIKGWGCLRKVRSGSTKLRGRGTATDVYGLPGLSSFLFSVKAVTLPVSHTEPEL